MELGVVDLGFGFDCVCVNSSGFCCVWFGCVFFDGVLCLLLFVLCSVILEFVIVGCACDLAAQEAGAHSHTQGHHNQHTHEISVI